MSDLGHEDSHQFRFVVPTELEGCQSKWLLSHAPSVHVAQAASEEGTSLGSGEGLALDWSPEWTLGRWGLKR